MGVEKGSANAAKNAALNPDECALMEEARRALPKENKRSRKYADEEKIKDWQDRDDDDLRLDDDVDQDEVDRLVNSVKDRVKLEKDNPDLAEKLREQEAKEEEAEEVSSEGTLDTSEFSDSDSQVRLRRAREKKKRLKSGKGRRKKKFMGIF